jgi:hypothetical protein
MGEKQMFKCIKGGVFGSHLHCNDKERLECMVFSFRDKECRLYEREDKSSNPYFGAIFNSVSAKILRDWLDECLKSSLEKCDFCYDYKMSEGLKITGTVLCDHCGSKIYNI